MKMIKETPEVYEKVVKVYIDQIPHSRLTWYAFSYFMLRNILSHKTETEKIVYEDLSPNKGFMIIPDLKWDQLSLSSLYVLAIVQNPSIRSLRDITPIHLPLLRAIATDGTRAVQARYEVPKEELRLFVHYQPSYYQFHVHIVHIEYTGFPGVATGQAHLLDDIIENLEQEIVQVPLPEKSFYARRTFTYALGENHEMFQNLWEATQVYHSITSDQS
ncbi:HIT-like domain-containing protein [Melampsora americana]|nr:HIT-like domain-containing protein [Melampsora americana]